jgi:hypothetical protein
MRLELRAAAASVWADPVLRLLALGYVALLALNYPGHMSHDSVVQLFEGRSGVYHDLHPAFMSWLLGVFDAVAPGVLLFVLFDMTLLFASLVVLRSLVARPSKITVYMLLVVLLLPQVLIFQAVVWKDVLFADCSVAGFVCFAIAGEHWRDTRLRFGLIAGAVLLLSMATLTRQNGAVVLLGGAVALAAVAWRNRAGVRSVLFNGLGFLVASVVLVLTVHTAVALRVTGDSGPPEELKRIAYYDLTGLLKADPSLPLAKFDAASPAYRRGMAAYGVPLYSTETSMTMFRSKPLADAYEATPRELVFAQWREAIPAHLGTYLRLRAGVFRWAALTNNFGACPLLATGIDGPPELLRNLGIAIRHDKRDKALAGYRAILRFTPAFSHLAFMLAGAGAAVLLLARRRPSDIALAALLASVFVFSLSFFFIAFSCDYRFLYPLDLAVLVALFHLALDWPSAWERVRRHRAAA